MLDFSVTPTTPQSNIEVEMALLGSILLDPNCIYQVAETLPKDAFYVESHKQIYDACLSLYKQQKTVTLLTVSNWLADKDLLQKVGGKNKLAVLIDNCVSTANTDAYAELLIEKHVRRQLSKLAAEIDCKAHEEDKPLAWTLENLEQRVLGITQLRNAKGGGYWQQIDNIAFERLCKELEDIESVENAALRDWNMRKLAKKWRFTNKKELLDFHAKWLDSQNKTQTYSAKEYFEKYGQSDQDWLIPGFVPAQSVIVLYADGGVGKTRLAFSLAKSAVSGGVFAYEGTEFNPMNTLLIETDQGPRNTSKLLEMQDFLSDEVSARFSICDDWSVGEFGKLKKMLDNHKPKLVIIDSLTSISVDSLYSETDAEYARPLVRLRHIAKDYNCSFLVIHHTNAGGDMRGSRAIRNTVDEVWKFTKQQNEIGVFNVLTIDKTRSRGPGSYKFTYDDESWGWVFGGRLEDDVIGGGLQSNNAMSTCIRFLNSQKGIPYEAQEVAQFTGLSVGTARKELRRAVTEGLINSGRSARDRRAVVYYTGTRLLRNITSDPSDPSDPSQRITFFPIQDKDSGRCDPSDPSISEKNSESNFKNADHLDHLDHIDLKPAPDIEKEVIQEGGSLPSDGSLVISLNTSEQPKFEQGQVCWHPQKLKRVKLIKLLKTKPEADILVTGEIEPIRVKLSELTEVPVTDLTSGENVEVTCGQHKGLKAIVSTVDRTTGIWLKKSSNGFNPAMGPFEAFQLKRIN